MKIIGFHLSSISDCHENLTKIIDPFRVYKQENSKEAMRSYGMEQVSSGYRVSSNKRPRCLFISNSFDPGVY